MISTPFTKIPVEPGSVSVDSPDSMFASAGNFLSIFWTPICSFLCLRRTKLCSPDIVTFSPTGIELVVTPLIVMTFVDVSTAVMVDIPELLIFPFVIVSSTVYQWRY